MGVQDNEGCSLLHWACFFGCDEILVEALLLANPHSARLPSRHDGSLPMHLAASWVRPSLVASHPQTACIGLTGPFTCCLSAAARRGAPPQSSLCSLRHSLGRCRASTTPVISHSKRRFRTATQPSHRFWRRRSMQTDARFADSRRWRKIFAATIIQHAGIGSRPPTLGWAKTQWRRLPLTVVEMALWRTGRGERSVMVAAAQGCCFTHRQHHH